MTRRTWLIGTPRVPRPSSASAGAGPVSAAAAAGAGEEGAAGETAAGDWDGPDWGVAGGAAASRSLRSARMMRPPGPLPVTCDRSRWFSLASLRTRGDAICLAVPFAVPLEVPFAVPLAGEAPAAEGAATGAG